MAQTGRALFNRYMQVISKWPIDVNKEGRDLSVNIRARIGQLFPKGELTNFPESQVRSVQREIESLERLIGNTHRNFHGDLNRNYRSASGLNLECLHRATSTQVIQSINEIYEMKLIDKIKLKLGF